MIAATAALAGLESIKASYGGDAAATKRQLVRMLGSRRLRSAVHVLRFHEALCFLRAYPDDADTLRAVEQALENFSHRSDLRRYRRDLADHGIAGTDIHYRFFWPMAAWVVRHWADRLHLDWRENGHAEQTLELLPFLVPFSETTGFDELDLEPRDWLERLKGPGETDAAFLVRRITAAFPNDSLREAAHDRMDLWYRFEAGPTTPSRTHAKLEGVRTTYQTGGLDRSRPDLDLEVWRRPRAVHDLSPRQGQRLVDMARAAMVTRGRDLDVFAYGDARDVRLVDFGDGLQFASIGFIPERRALLHAIYGFLTLKNGVPIGYVLASALYRHAEVAYNTFETYRGGEAARVFARVLAMAHHLFGAVTFSIDPYQLGHGNKEGLASGAWWFYYKLGFRPHDPDVLRVLRGELRAMRANPRHRSTLATLKKLAAEHVFFAPRRGKSRRARGSAGERRVQLLPLWNVSLGISDFLAQRFGAEREQGIRVCASDAARLLGVSSLRGFSAEERQAWERWGPLVAAMPEVTRWSAADKRALAHVIRAKGGRRDSDFVQRFDAHRTLQRAILRLAARAEP
ncbi:MAG TPA: hypothetical protein VFD07_08105 [Candidatus Krumholzibacteria bacterium]|nr:hypothetical protein [Candidatus Krumholzibacteria bacterium]